MGYTGDLMSTTLTTLTAMQRDLASLINLFQADADQQLKTVGVLENDSHFKGKDATQVKSMTHNYSDLVHQHALDRLQQIADACSRYHNAIQSASDAFDGVYPPNYSDYADYLFANYGFTDVPGDLPHGNQDVERDVTSARPEYITQFTQQYTAAGKPMHRFIIDEIETEITDVNSALLVWGNALDHAFTVWQTSLKSTDFHDIVIPTLSYDDGKGNNVPIPIDTKYESILTGDFNKLGLANDIVAPVPEDYLAVVQTYSDPRTQQVLLLMMTTPTGRGFAEYLLAMAKQPGVGPNFIIWQSIPKPSKDLTTDGFNNPGGYITLNTDVFDPNDPQKVAFMAGVLVHEATESYFKVGLGLRDMGSRHADYVAEWFQAKYQAELQKEGYPAAGDTQAYGMDYTTWYNSVGHGGYSWEHTHTSTTIQDPGWTGNGYDYWQAGLLHGSNAGLPWSNTLQVDLTQIPNPAHLVPGMQSSPDMNKIDPLPRK